MLLIVLETKVAMQLTFERAARQFEQVTRDKTDMEGARRDSNAVRHDCGLVDD